ncbi:unnamed protein product [Rhizophagus irregularis]|nr:unnamed protein product [Rhizophagus irregularis]
MQLLGINDEDQTRDLILRNAELESGRVVATRISNSSRSLRNASLYYQYEFIEVYSAFLTCSSVTDMDKSDFAYLDIRKKDLRSELPSVPLVKFVKKSVISRVPVYRILLCI